MERTGLARRIRERGLELGLGAIGFAPIGPSAQAAALRDWLGRGRHGTMTYMARTAEERMDVRRRFPWARSAVMAAVTYLPYRGGREAQEGVVRNVARYAVGRDYHRVLADRLRALDAFILAEAPGARTQVYTDTGPVLERELAARAGLGWFGKNTNLIGPRGDSWTLLGEILTDLDLPAGEPVADRCGTCTACLDACPTGAIPQPYVVDSTRCISYLTIELKGSIPEPQRADLENWVFGCDICQEVCPWNRKVAATGDPAFLPSDDLRRRSLADLVRITGEEFRATFGESPIERTRHRGLVRNALIVAANTGDEEALAAARERASDADPVIRETARWAVDRRRESGHDR